MKFYEAANKSRPFSSVFCSQKWFGTDFWVFSVTENWFGTEFRFFSSENYSERNSEVFSLPSNGSERNSEVFSSENSLEWNSKGFSLQRIGSERNFEIFIFWETGGILTELPSVRSCSVLFRTPWNNFFVGKWQPYSYVEKAFLKSQCHRYLDTNELWSCGVLVGLRSSSVRCQRQSKMENIS